MDQLTGTALELELVCGDLVKMTSVGGSTGKEVGHSVGIVTKGPRENRWFGCATVLVLYADSDFGLRSFGKENTIHDRYRLFERLLPAVEVQKALQALIPQGRGGLGGVVRMFADLVLPKTPA